MTIFLKVDSRVEDIPRFAGQEMSTFKTIE